MIARRLPIAVLLVALVAAAFAVDPRRDDAVRASGAVTAAALSPLATAVGAGSSTWFCAGGSAAVTGPAEHTITLANPTDEAATGTLQLFLEGQDPQSFPVAVPARDQAQVALSTLAQGEWAAALVELDRGGVVVTHEVVGLGGWDSDRCSSQASDRWYLPWGQTAPQEASSLRLALFNPFAVEAVVDMSFDTDDGFRTPEALQGFLVPPRRLVTVDVTNLVPVRQRVSTEITARSGRLVVARLQSLSGVDGTVTLDVTPAAPSAATSWYFADGRVDADTLERISVYNPSDATAQVEVEISRARTTRDLAIEPFELQIAPQSYAEVVLNDEGRVPKPLRHTTVVRSLNDVAVVAERVQLSSTVKAAAATAAAEAAEAAQSSATTAVTTAVTTADGAPADATAGTTTTIDPSQAAAEAAAAGMVPLPPGLSATLGSPLVATRWVLPNAARADVVSAKLVVANVSNDQPADFELHLFRGSEELPVDLPSATTELEPRQQVEIPLSAAAGEAPLLAVVEASGMIVVDGVQTYGPLADVSVHGAVPLPEGVRVPDPLDADIGLGEEPTTTVAAPTGGSGSTSIPGAGTGSTTGPSTTTTAPTTTAPTTTVPTTVTTVPATSTTVAPTTAPPDTTPTVAPVADPATTAPAG